MIVGFGRGIFKAPFITTQTVNVFNLMEGLNASGITAFGIGTASKKLPISSVSLDQLAAAPWTDIRFCIGLFYCLRLA